VMTHKSDASSELQELLLNEIVPDGQPVLSALTDAPPRLMDVGSHEACGKGQPASVTDITSTTNSL
jgi:hypothetical protein